MISLNKEFDELKTEEEKIEYIAKFPERILLLDDLQVKLIECGADPKAKMLLAKLKRVAIKNAGDLILVFERNGFSVDNSLIDLAFKSDPNICRFCDESWLTPRRIKWALEHDVNNYQYLPKEFFTYDDKQSTRMVRISQRAIRQAVLKSKVRYKSLAPAIISGTYSAYTSINAFTEDNEFNALRTEPELWDCNGGKIMFKIMRKNMDLGLKMLNEKQRVTLAIAILDKDVDMYERLPLALQFNKEVKKKLYRKLRLLGAEKLKSYFTKQEQEELERKFLISEKRNATRRKNKQKLEQEALLEK